MNSANSPSFSLVSQLILLVRVECSPLHAGNGAGLVEKIVFLLAPPIDGHGVVVDFRASFRAVLLRQANEQIDAHANLDAENIVGGAGELGVLADVAPEFQNVDQVEVLGEVLAHAVE